MHNNTGSPTAETFNELYPAILECFGIILLGYIAGRTHIVSLANSKGLGNYVTYFALPALVYKAMVELDFQKVRIMTYMYENKVVSEKAATAPAMARFPSHHVLK